jgi:hypothetical protein
LLLAYIKSTIDNTTVLYEENRDPQNSPIRSAGYGYDA